MCHTFSVSRHLGCFPVVATVNSAALKVGIGVSSWITVFSGYMSRSGIAGPYSSCQFSSVQSLSHVLTLWSHGLQHARLPCPSPTPRAWSDSGPSSQWCHPTISSSVIPFSSYLQSFQTSGCFPVSQFFTSGGRSIGVSTSSVLPMNIQDQFPLGLTGLISLQSKGLARVFSSTTVQKHHFFGAQLSLWSNSHIHMWLLEKP